jgi:inosine-uridine nucleoside N-ribohydrolase
MVSLLKTTAITAYIQSLFAIDQKMKPIVGSLALLIFLVMTTGQVARAKPERILLDTDIGTDVDDALALAFAANSSEVELVSVTTVGAKPEVRAKIASKLLELLGKGQVPVVSGLGRPLPSQRFRVWLPEWLWLGHEGKGILLEGEVAQTSRNGSGGIAQIVSTLMAAQEKVTVITVGPVSNLAAALRQEPRIAEKVKHWVMMGGSVLANPTLGGRELTPLAEFNFNADREATAIAMTSRIPKTIVPVELTIQTALSLKDVRTLRMGGGEATRVLVDLIDVWTPVFHRIYRSMGVPESDYQGLACHLHDVLAVLVAVHPNILSFKDVRISVKEENGILLTRAEPSGEVPVRVATGANLIAVRELVMARLKQGS